MKNKSVIYVCIILIASLGVAIGGCGSKDSGSKDSSGGTVVISVKDYGDITVELDPKQAPVTVENFEKLVKDGFYDGLTFHRVIPNFMIQGGDPKGDGTGGSKDMIKGEFKNNGVDNTISHERGVISMARSNDPNSASSQFFITSADSTHLDGDYAAFGKVTKGMDVVDKISEVKTDGNDKPEKSVIIEKIVME